MTIRERIAAAPISWGVCEVPGWGHQLDPDTVLTQARELGVTAIEFGPDGFLPQEPLARAVELRRHRLQAVGGFFPILLHDPASDPLPAVQAELDAYVASGANTIVLSAVSGRDGYDERVELAADDWTVFFERLEQIRVAAVEAGVTPTLHPHIGTIVERADEVGRVLDHSGIGLTLDTGHLFIGGTDPVELARRHGDRIAHTHLKDVDNSIAEQVRSGARTYYQAVVDGMYRPLGSGDARIRDIVLLLESQGYHGWYTAEQDTVLRDADGAAGALADVRTSIEFLRSLDPTRQPTGAGTPAP